MKPLLQARSRATLDRLLDATEALLETRAFDEVSIAEIAHGAQVTSGAIYARFPDKDSILLALHDRLSAQMAPVIATTLDVERWRARRLEDSLDELFARSIEIYRRHAPVIRALTDRARAKPDLRALLERENVARIAAVTRCVLASPNAARHPQPERSVHFALLMTTGAMREAILFHDYWPRGFDVSDAWLARELARGFVGYLAAVPRGRSGRARPPARRPIRR